MRLDAPLRLAVPRLGNPDLAPGWYVYAGSAHGPGGMAARVARHLKQYKAMRWHIDHLTAATGHIDVRTFAGGGECAIIDVLSGHAGVWFPVPGFGSSDCRHCRAHLVALRDRAVADTALDGLLSNRQGP